MELERNYQREGGKIFVVQQALDLNGQFFSIYSWIIFGFTVYFLVLVMTLFLISWLFTYSRFLYFFANLSLFLCICNVLHFLCHIFVKFCHSISWLDDWTKDIFPSKMFVFGSVDCFYYMANPVLGKSLCSDWFFLGQDFAVRTVSMEMVQSVYFCFGVKPAN